MHQQAQTLLQEVFGYDSFRPLQHDIITNVLNKRDTLVVMPTGGGKSLCYQIPALLFDGVTIVVSPLISLMKDQVEQLHEVGAGAVFLNSSLSYDEYRRNVARIMRDEAKLLYVAPETLLMQKTLALLDAKTVTCLAIDEAHCISEWGHDFRPEYRQLVEVRSRFPDAVSMALTATATPRVQEDIKTSLHFESSNAFIASFNRPNLFLDMAAKTDPMLQTVEFVEQFPQQSGIIYCATRRQVDELAAILAGEGFSAKPYHAGLSDQERHRNQDAFIRDDVQIIVATIAFGMGIDKPNIRFIVHYDLPKNIESYYQQIGRAGRDGLRAHCLLLYSYSDIRTIKYFIDQKSPEEQRIAALHLDAMVGLAETDVCRRVPLLRYFGEQYTASNCGMCDNCTQTRQDLVDITIPAQKFLSCVKRTGEIFGAGHVIDVLHGSRAQKVVKHRHDQLSTYGIGLEYSKKQWFHLSRQFLQKGLMTQDAQYGSLKLTPKAWEVFRGREKVVGKIEADHRHDAPTSLSDQAYDTALFEILRRQRKELADAANLPPYVIFPDTALIDMAAYFPQSAESLLTMQGVGAARVEKHGDLFLTLIRDYCAAHEIAEKPKRQWKSPLAKAKTSDKPRHVSVGDAFNGGKSVQELMAAFGVKQRTILNHLLKYLQAGYSLERADDFLNLSTLSADQQQQVLRTYEALGAERLRPIFEALNERISYDELHILRLYYLTYKEAAS